MSKTNLLRWLIGTALILGIYAAWATLPPRRPKNVPAAAVFVSVPKSGFWQICRFDQVQRADHCTVFDKYGEVRYDEEFLPYDGGPAAGPTELDIDRNSHYADFDRVVLRNGRILLPKSVFENQRRFLDEWVPGVPQLRKRDHSGE